MTPIIYRGEQSCVMTTWGETGWFTKGFLGWLARLPGCYAVLFEAPDQVTFIYKPSEWRTRDPRLWAIRDMHEAYLLETAQRIEAV